jgi:hypothetical protein
MTVKSKQGTELMLGGEPRVNLLPPEVAERAKARATRRLLALLVILSMVVVGGGVTAAYFYAVGAEARLVAAQERTQELLTEQLRYSDATRLANLVEATIETRALGTSTEIMWAEVIDQVTAFLPKDASITTLAAVGRAPWDPTLEPLGPLREPRVATLNIVVQSATILDGTALLRKLNSIEGFADASPDLVVVVEGGVSTTITFNIDTEALANRFPAKGTEEEP